MILKPDFWRTLSEARLSLAVRACSGRVVTDVSCVPGRSPARSRADDSAALLFVFAAAVVTPDGVVIASSTPSAVITRQPQTVTYAQVDCQARGQPAAYGPPAAQAPGFGVPIVVTGAVRRQRVPDAGVNSRMS
jgi:hypothetical protein